MTMATEPVSTTEGAPQVQPSSRTSTPVRKNRLQDILNPAPDLVDGSVVTTSGRASVEPCHSIDGDETVAPHSTRPSRCGLFNYRTINAENIAIVNAKLADFLLADTCFNKTELDMNHAESSASRKRKSLEQDSDARDIKRRHVPTSDSSSQTLVNEEDRSMSTDEDEEEEEEEGSQSRLASPHPLPPSSSSVASSSVHKPSPSPEEEISVEDDDTLSTTDADTHNNGTNARTIITCRFGSCNAIINTIHSPLGYHLNEHHKPSTQDRNGDVACQWDTCGVQVKWRNLRRHIMESHLGTLSKDCSGCGKMFSRSDALKRHQKHYCGGKKMPAQAGLGWEGAAKMKHAAAVGVQQQQQQQPSEPTPFSSLPPPLLQPLPPLPHRSGSGAGPLLEPIPPTGRSVGRGRGRTPPRKSRPYPSPTDPSSSYYRPTPPQDVHDHPKPTKTVHTTVLSTIDPHRHYPREIVRAQMTTTPSRSLSSSSHTTSSLALSDSNTPYRRYSSLHNEHISAPKPVVFQWRSTVSWD